jgi:hypothetical protein
MGDPRYEAGMKRDMGAIRLRLRTEWLARERERTSRITGAVLIREPIGGCPTHATSEAAAPLHATWDVDSTECLCLLSAFLVEDDEPRPKVRSGHRIKWLR